MKTITFLSITLLISVSLLFNGCQKKEQQEQVTEPSTTQLAPEEQSIPSEPLTEDEIKAFEGAMQNTKSQFDKDASDENKKAYVTALTDYGWALINRKGDFDTGLAIYKQLYEYDDPNTEVRKKLLRYLLTLNLDKITEKNIEEANRMAQALYEFRPDEFYVQARMIMVASLKAEKAFEEGKYDEALNWARKSTSYRFDAIALDKRIQLEINTANVFIDQGKVAETQDLIRNITYTVQLKGNESLHAKYNTQIQELIQKFDQVK